MLFFLVTVAACGGGDGDGGGDGGGEAKSPSPAGAQPPPSAAKPPPSEPAPSLAGQGDPPPGRVEFFATFPNPGQIRTSSDSSDGISDDGMWWVEQKTPGKAVVVNIGRDGNPGLRLHTDPGDTNVSGSGNFERNDVALLYTDGMQGEEYWWAHSVLFPDDFAIPPWELPTARAVVFDFHDTRNQGGQANFHVVVEPGGLLAFRGHGGPSIVVGEPNQYSYGADIGALQTNTWYDFVYHVKWSAYGDGYFQAWVNGVKKLDHYGPTLYEGYGVYLKLANYHTALGKSSSVIHDRVMRGTTWQAVSPTSLEGVSP